jgi:hypothetical protein
MLSPKQVHVTREKRDYTPELTSLCSSYSLERSALLSSATSTRQARPCLVDGDSSSWTVEPRRSGAMLAARPHSRGC